MGNCEAPWRRVGVRATEWVRILGVNDWVKRVLVERIRDWPTNVERGKEVLKAIPQSTEDLEFGRMAIEKGLEKEEYWGELTEKDARGLVELGYTISPAFTNWEGVDGDGIRRGRFIQDFSVISRQWVGVGTKMETKEGFAGFLRRDDRLL